MTYIENPSRMTEIRVVSNYTEIGTFDRVNAALAFALDESEQFDDVIVIEQDGVEVYMVRHGRAFRLGRPVSRKSANPDRVVADAVREIGGTVVDASEAATRAAGLEDLYRHALPSDAPGAWVRDAIDRQRRETT